MEPAKYIHDHAPEEVRDLAHELLLPMVEGEPVSERLVEDLVHTVVRLRLLRVSDTLNQLRYMQEELQQEGDLTLGALPGIDFSNSNKFVIDWIKPLCNACILNNML